MTKTLAWEWAPYHIRVNCLSPGYMITKLNKCSQEPETQLFKDIIEATPLRRMGKPEELKGAIVFLASDASEYITGQTLLVDGGISTGATRALPKG